MKLSRSFATSPRRRNHFSLGFLTYMLDFDDTQHVLALIGMLQGIYSSILAARVVY
jgi:hypothetical protein